MNKQYALRTFVFILLTGLISSTAYSQTKNRITVSSGISSNAIFQSGHLSGGGSNEGKGATAFGIRYTRNLNHSFAFETGLEYSSNKIETTPAFTGQQMQSTRHNIQMLSVPVYGNYTFLKYLFVNAGAVIDFESNVPEYRSVDNQSGIGFGFGVGGKYTFKKVTILANPFFQNHAVVHFEQKKYQERLAEIGVKFGIGYNF